MDGEKLRVQPVGSHQAVSEDAIGVHEVRIVRPVRNQVELVMEELDALVPEDHVVRAIWAFLERLDLSDLYAAIRAAPGRPGRPASDPMVLLALWVYATAEGVGSARELARLCKEHDGFRWLRGGVPVDYHLLSDFRRDHEKALDDLLTQIIALLMDAGLVKLKEVVQAVYGCVLAPVRGPFGAKSGWGSCCKRRRRRLNDWHKIESTLTLE